MPGVTRMIWVSLQLCRFAALQRWSRWGSFTIDVVAETGLLGTVVV